jgi:hypothetical protein
MDENAGEQSVEVIQDDLGTALSESRPLAPVDPKMGFRLAMAPKIPGIDINQIWSSQLTSTLLAASTAMERAFRPALTTFSDMMPRFGEILNNLTKVMEPLARLSAEFKKHDRIEQQGWLVHRTTPIGLLHDSGVDDAEISDHIEAHYRQNWHSIRKDFTISIESYAIDHEAKDTFLEALDAHEAGLFRLVPRGIFPEIERVVRIEIHGGSMDKMASLGGLRKEAEELGIGEFAEDVIRGVMFYKKFDEYVYANATTPEMIAKIAVDPMPNRHATVHGYASYRSFQNSINALCFADYLFRLVDTIKRSIDETKVESSGHH